MLLCCLVYFSLQSRNRQPYVYYFVKKQEVQLSMTHRPTLMHASVKIFLIQNAMKHSFLCCAVKSCLLAIYWPNFLTFIYPSFIWRPKWAGSPRAIEFISGVGKLEWFELQSRESCITIDSVILAQYINVTDTATSPQKMPRQRTASCGRNVM